MAFIVFEGIDGAGKTTLIQSLQSVLIENAQSVVLTREPGGTALGDELREIIIRKAEEVPNPRCEILLYEAIRAQHVEQVIRPALQNNQWVLCDRFTASSIAFQAGGRGLNSEQIHWLNDFATTSLQPDLWVLLDLPIEVAHRRFKGRFETDRFENEKADFHQRVRESYLRQSQGQKNWLVLDAQQPSDQLLETVTNRLREEALLK